MPLKSGKAEEEEKEEGHEEDGEGKVE